MKLVAHKMTAGARNHIGMYVVSQSVAVIKKATASDSGLPGNIIFGRAMSSAPVHFNPDRAQQLWGVKIEFSGRESALTLPSNHNEQVTASYQVQAYTEPTKARVKPDFNWNKMPARMMGYRSVRYDTWRACCGACHRNIATSGMVRAYSSRAPTSL
jgi:hypothetical protein